VKKWLRRAGIALLAVVALLLVLVALVHTPPVKRLALERVIRFLASQGIDARIDRLDYNIPGLSARATGLSLAASHRPDEPFFEARDVHAVLPWSVVLGRFSLDRVDVSEAHLRLVRDADGHWNLPRTEREREREGLTRLDIRRLSIRDFDATIEDHQGDFVVGVEGFTADLREERLGDGLSGPISAAGLVRVTFGERTIAVDHLVGQITYDGRDVQFTPVRFDVLAEVQEREAGTRPGQAEGRVGRTRRVEDAPGRAAELGRVELRGRLASVFARQTMDAAMTGTVDLSPLVRWLDIGTPAAGEVAWSGRVEGPLGELRITADFESERVAYGPLHDVAVRGTAEYTDDVAEVTDVVARLAGGTARGQARFAFGDPATRTELDVTWSDLRAQQVAAMAGGFDGRIAALLDGRARLRFTGSDWRTLQGRLENRSRPGGAPGVEVSGQVDATFAGGQWRLQQEHRVGAIAAVGEASGVLETELGASTLTGRMQVNAPNVPQATRTLTGLGIDVPDDLVRTLQGSARAETTLAGTLRDPAFHADVAADDFAVYGLTNGPLVAQVSWVGRTLRAQDLSWALGANEVQAEVSVHFDRRTLDGTFSAALPDLPAAAAFAADADRYLTEGSGVAQGRIGGTLDVPEVWANLDAVRVVAAGQAFERVYGEVGYVGTSVVTRGLQLEQPGEGWLTADVRIDLRTDAYDMRFVGDGLHVIEIPAGVLFERAVPVDTVLESVEFAGEGTFARPAGEARLTFSDATFGGFPVGSGSAHVSLHGTEGAVTMALADLGGRFEANTGLQRPYPFRATLSLDKPDVVSLFPRADLRLDLVRLHVALDAVAEGRLADLDTITAVATVTRLDGFVETAPVRLLRPSRLHYSDRHVYVDDVELSFGSTRLTATGGVGEDLERFRATFSGSLADLVPLARVAGLERPLVMQGPFILHLEASGPIAAPDAYALLVVDEGQASIDHLPPAYGLNVNAEYQDGVLTLRELEGQWQGASVSATGTIPAHIAAERLPDQYVASLPPPPGPARVEVAFSPLTPRVLEPFVAPHVLQQLDGRIVGRAALESTGLALEDLRGDIRLEDVALVVANVPFEQVRPTVVALEEGRVRVTDWEWVGGGNRLVASGGVTLGTPEGVRLDAAVDGDLDLRMLGAFFPQLASGGRADLSLSIAGPLARPELDGLITLRESELRVRDPRVLVSQLEGRLVFTRDTLRVDGLQGLVNGGPLTVEGRVAFPDLEITEADLSIEARGMAIEYPAGLQTEVDARLSLTQAAGQPTPLLAGTVSVLRGSYRAPISLLALAQRGADAPRLRDFDPDPGPFDPIRLNVEITTVEDIVVDNNYGRFQAGADLRLVGTIGEPGLAGRATLREGGEVFLAGTRYRLEQSTVDFVSPDRIEPELGIIARTRVAGNDIRLDISGRPATLEVELTSEAGDLGQADLASLLVTGRTLDETAGAEADIAREQALALLSGEILGTAGRAVGLDSVRLTRGTGVEDDLRFDPTLVAAETNPATRLTVSEEFGDRFEVVLSQNLQEAGKLTWILAYKPFRNIEVRFVSFDNSDRTYEFRQDLHFGGAPWLGGGRRPTAPAPRVAAVRIEGTPGFDERTLRRQLRLRAGDRFDFFRWQDDRDRLLSFFHDRKFLEARIGATRRDARTETGEPALALVYAVHRGPATSVEVEGVSLPGSLLAEIEQEWARAVFDGFLVDDATRLVRLHTAREGFLRADIRARVTGDEAGDWKTLLIEVAPGPRSATRTVEIAGNTVFTDLQVVAALRGARVFEPMWVDPMLAVRAVRREYERAGYIEAQIEADEIRFVEDEAVLPLRVEEGRQYSFGDITLSGVTGADEGAVRSAIALGEGVRYDPEQVPEMRRRVETYYRRLGFNAARTTTTTSVDRDRPRVHVTVRVDEGPQQVLASVQVTGAERTQPRVINRAVTLEEGEPVDIAEVYRSRKRLYDTGVFRRADIEIVPVEPEATIADGERQPVRAVVSLNERAPWRLRYGLQVSDEAGIDDTRNVSPGLVADLQYRNLFGRAMAVGVAGRAERDFQAGRTFFTAPRLLGLPLQTNVYAVRTGRSLRDRVIPIRTTRSSFVAEQRFNPGRTVLVSYGWDFRRIRTKFIDAEQEFDVPVNVSTLASAGLFDTRDSPFDAHRGWFHASAIEYGSAAIGSDVRFIKYSLQQYYYRQVRPQVVLASAFRIGLAEGFGQRLIFDERFFAGGGNTVRGYRDDSLGPLDFFGDPLGGEALLVLNQEIRFPIWRWLRGVGFLDAGNVFLQPSDMSLGELKWGAGLGARIQTPFALFRIDFGVPLSDRPDVRRGRWVFSLGQAF
jgi:outer membrane protein assembly complex protein YaeT